MCTEEVIPIVMEVTPILIEEEVNTIKFAK